jgi:hypothetical protein
MGAFHQSKRHPSAPSLSTLSRCDLPDPEGAAQDFANTLRKPRNPVNEMATTTDSKSRLQLRQIAMDAADLPIGHVAFVLLAVGGLFWALFGELSAEGYIGGVAAASGLLAVGHGIRHQRRK